MSIYVLGHKNPDTDSIVSALALSALHNALGVPATACMQGEMRPESAFILERFAIAAPELRTSVAGKQIFLVDFSDLMQAPDDIAQAEVLGVVDHHKLGDLTTPAPLEMWVWPVGCTCTVIKNMFDFHKKAIPAPLAGAMLCAILSDTVLFKSVTCTEQDRQAAQALAQIAGVEDIMALGFEMFKAKSSLDNASPRDLLLRDFKDFIMGGKKVGIGQFEIISLFMLEPLKAGFMDAMRAVKAEQGHHTIMFLLTDIMEESSELLFISDEPELLQEAFHVTPQANSMWLPGVMSRKKQLIPQCEKAFSA